MAAASKFSLGDSLKLKASVKPHLVMELEMSSKLYDKIMASRGEDMDLENTILKFKGDTVSINEAHLHGQTTLQFERKSYSIDADKKIKLCKGCEGLGDFYLVSLSMDKNYFHNRLCFDLLNTLGLFHLQYAYSEVKINGKSQGIYLILATPAGLGVKGREFSLYSEAWDRAPCRSGKISERHGQRDEKKVSRPVFVNLQAYQSIFGRRSS